MSGWYAENALLGVELDIVSVEIGECLAQVVEEGVLLFGFDEDVVDIDLDVAPNLFAESILHHALVRSTCVLEPEGHCGVAVDAMWRYEGCFVLVFGRHPYLVIA